MKQQLLIGAALLGALTVTSQTSRPGRTGVLPYNICEAKYGIRPEAVETRVASPLKGSGANNPANALAKESAQVTSVSWNLLCGSMNVNGMLVSHSRPLQYNDELNAVSFIHRKSDTYTTSPALSSNAESGVVVAEVSSDWGTTWDSTTIWLSESQWGRYPQGAIYNPPSNTSLSNAYIVGSGPTVAGSSFTGNFYTSKQLNAFNSTSSTATGAQQFYSFSLSSYPAGQAAHGWGRCGFTSTDDGLVRSLAIIEGDYQGLETVRGFAVATGSFNGTAFDWTVDTLMPDCYIDADDGEKQLSPDPQMAFNESGTIGYIVGLGALNGQTLANKSYQPIVYKMDKTLSSTATWTLMNGIDFNDPGMLPVIKSTFLSRRGLAGLHVVGNDTIGVPFVDDYDIVVDKDGYLHIAATVMSAFSEHPDSLEFIAQFTTSINPTEQYKWRHTPGSRPYLYDFIGNGVGTWTYVVVDSIASEGPSAAPAGDGFNDNPWDLNSDGLKVNMDSRIQVGRSPDGQYITYSWVESDSAITNNQFKWNTFPNIKVRMMEVLNGPIYNLALGNEQNITAGFPKVFTRATLHYMSPKSSAASVQATGVTTHSMDVQMPFTVTNSSPYSQTTNNSTYYGQANLTFGFTTYTFTGVQSRGNYELGASIYPNPAHHSLNVEVVSPANDGVDIVISNAMGQRVAILHKNVSEGVNTLPMDVQNLAPGIYFVTIQINDQQSTKKLVIE